MIASSWGDLVLGTDIHLVNIPSPAGPVPTPVPMAFLGMVYDLAGMMVGAAIGIAMGSDGPALVTVNGAPATTCGTGVISLFPHIPAPGVSFTMGLPANDAELAFGAKDVTFMGSSPVRLGDLALSCGDPIRLPTSVVLALPKGAPVIINRPMVPDIEGMATGMAFRGIAKVLGAAMRGAAQAGRRFFRTARAFQHNSVFWRNLSAKLRSNDPRGWRAKWDRAVCFVTGHPVDVVTGRMFTEAMDFELPGALPLRFERAYDSSLSWRDGSLGRGWSHSLDEAVWGERGYVVYRAPDGRPIEFETWDLPEHVIRPGQEVYDSVNRLTLRCLGPHHFEVETHDGIRSDFRPVLGDASGRCRILSKRTRDGHTIEYRYDARGHLESVRDTGGRLVGFEHDARGRLRVIKLPLSRDRGLYRCREFHYDDAGDLVKVTDAAGKAWTYDYVTHLMVRETDREGLSFYFEYDGLGDNSKCIRTWGDGGIYHHVITYNPRKRTTVVEDSLGYPTVYKYDEANQVIELMNAHGGRTRYAYDDDGRTVLEIDPLGGETHTEYDERGNVARITGPDGAAVAVRYDGHNLPVEATDANGGTWRWSYDNAGHLVGKLHPDGSAVRYEWRDKRLSAVETLGGRRTELTYDDHGNVRTVRAPNGAETRYWTDNLGRVMKVRDGRGAVTAVRHDVEGRVIETHTPTGGVERRTYDAEGNLVEVQDATRHVRLRYGGFHKVIAREEGGAEVRFEYDAEDRVIAVVNEAGERYSFEYDALGEVKTETGFDGGKRTYLREPLTGRVTRTILPSGRSTEHTYDVAGRITGVKHSDGTGAGFVYRADGALLLATNESAEVVFERDALGRVVREQCDEHSVTSRYGADGERYELESSLGAHEIIEHDALGDVELLRLGAGAGPGVFDIGFQRDAAGLERARTLPGGLRVEWRRDEAGRPTARRTVHTAGGDPREPLGGGVRELGAEQYVWRGEDQIAALLDPVRGDRHFEHDGRGRLVRERRNGRTLDRAMDAVGNVYRTAERTDRRYGAGGRLEEAEGTRFEHDRDGNLTAKIEPDGSTWRYRWNGAGLLSEVQRPDGQVVAFEYDPFARRTRKVLHEAPEPAPRRPPLAHEPLPRGAVQTESRFVWDGHVVLHEAQAGAEPVTWHWEPGTFTPVAKAQGERRWSVASDHLGTPTEMYDELGRLAWRMQLDAFGVATIEEGDASDCPWRWPGQHADAETGEHYNRFRYYDPATGRYTSRDPLGIVPGNALFSYPGDPIIGFDVFGLAPEAPTVTALFEHAGQVFDDVNPLARDPRTHETIPAPPGHLGNTVENKTMFKAHAEVGAMNQARKAGQRGGHGVLVVGGRPICTACRRDIKKMALLLDLDSLEIHELDTGKSAHLSRKDFQNVAQGGASLDRKFGSGCG